MGTSFKNQSQPSWIAQCFAAVKVILIYGACLATLNVLSGCQPIPVKPKADSTALSWDISGKIAIRAGNESTTARVKWHQSGAHFKLLLLDPLGRTQVKLEQQQNQAHLWLKDHGEYIALKADNLLYQHTGWHLPVDQMPMWIQGIPTPGAKLELDELQQLRSLHYEQWQIDYLAYSQQQGRMLPKKLRITGPDTQIRLAISEWTFHD
ncbi:MAG: outer membrane lipoprotein LolB [Kangiellaceae bacterium]|nr:outer membrane lipoprotein LolB [Kangiellaceae bacterium]